MKVLVVGSGAREHALAWRLTQSPALTELHAAPGNPGIASLGRCHPVRADDGDGLLSLALTVEADLAVIGPEAPLVAGVADLLRQNGVAVFGPSASAARIEGSKAFAKDVLRAAGVPMAETMSVARAPCVIKADGLASGKGVFVCHTPEEVDAALVAVAALGEEFVIEELLDGPEVSLFALCDGRRALPIGAAQDFKRIGDGDTGPNTGGMGAYSPVAGIPDVDSLVAQVHQPVLDELARRGSPFIGCLFAGLMLTPEPKVLEFNARFGDPETQVLMARWQGDLVGPLSAAAQGDLGGAADRAIRRERRDGRRRGPRLSRQQRLRRRADRRHRRGRANGRARLPRRHGDEGRARRDEWRQNPLRDGTRQLGQGGARARLRGGRPRLVRGRAGAAGHRGGGRWLSRWSGS